MLPFVFGDVGVRSVALSLRGPWSHVQVGYWNHNSIEFIGELEKWAFRSVYYIMEDLRAQVYHVMNRTLLQNKKPQPRSSSTMDRETEASDLL